MRALFACIILLVMFLTFSVARAEVLPRAGTCGGCHTESFEGWGASAHARSTSSKAFRRGLKTYLLEEGTDSGAYCFRCHAPGVFISGGVFEFTRAVLKEDVPGGGVTCVVCHSVEAVKDGGVVYDLGESPGYHRVKDLRSIERKELCTTCHSVYKEESKTESAEASETSDHTFPGVIVAYEEDGVCPGMKGGTVR